MIKTFNKISYLGILNVITLGDKILVVFMIVLGIISFFALNRLRQPGNIVIIEVAGQLKHQINLNESREISVSGPIGKTRIKIAAGAAQVIQSDCPEKICIQTGKIRHAGEIIVCVPNRVVVRISGTRHNPFDIITE